MMRSKWLRVLVLVAVGAMLLALPLAGCKKQSGTAGGGQDTGGQGSGGTSGGSTAAVGFFKFQAGQYLKYRVSVAGATDGWFTVNITDGGSGKLKLDVAGNYAGRPSRAPSRQTRTRSPTTPSKVCRATRLP